VTNFLHATSRRPEYPGKQDFLQRSNRGYWFAHL